MTEQNTEQQYHTDSRVLTSILSQLGTRSGIANPVTGMGTGRDPGEYLRVVSTIKLTREECNDIYGCSVIAENIVDVYPTEASWAKFVFESTNYRRFGADSDKAQTYFKSFRSGSLHKSFIEVSIEARLHGEAYLLLGVDDGQSYDKPINEDNIQSFDEVKVLTKYEVKPYNPNRNSIYDLDYYQDDIEQILDKGFREYNPNANEYWVDRPEFYEIKLNRPILPNKSDKRLIIHKSRIIKFTGKFLPVSVLKDCKHHDSVMQACFNAWITYEEGIKNAATLLRDHSFFWYALDGLGALVQSKNYDAIYNRFLSIQMSKNVLKGIAIDRRSEEVGWHERNLGNVDKLLDVFKDYLVSESRMVRYKVLGQSQDQGLGGAGRGQQERMQHALNLKKWVEFNWAEPIFYCLRLALKSKTGFTNGRVPSNFSLQFDPVYELTPLEIVELMEKSQKFASEAIADKILTPLEVRYSLYNRTDPVIIPSFTLDERYTEILEENLQNEYDNVDVPDTEDTETGIIKPLDEDEESELEETLDSYNLDSAPDDSCEGIDFAIEAHNTEYIDTKDFVLDYVDASEWFSEYNQDASYPMLVWFSDRGGKNKHRTPIAVRVQASNASEARTKAISAARRKCKRHCEVSYSVRRATASEVRTASKGRWIRTGAKGQKQGYRGIKGVGVPLGGYKKDEAENQLSDKDQTALDKAISALTDDDIKRIEKSLDDASALDDEIIDSIMEGLE